MAGPPTLQVQTYARGDVPREAMDLAAKRAGSLLRLAPEPVLFARVKLTLATDPAVEHPAERLPAPGRGHHPGGP